MAHEVKNCDFRINYSQTTKRSREVEEKIESAFPVLELILSNHNLDKKDNHIA